MLITCVLHIWPEGQREPRNEVGSVSQAELLVGFETGTFRFQSLSLWNKEFFFIYNDIFCYISMSKGKIDRYGTWIAANGTLSFARLKFAQLLPLY